MNLIPNSTELTEITRIFRQVDSELRWLKGALIQARTSSGSQSGSTSSSSASLGGADLASINATLMTHGSTLVGQAAQILALQPVRKTDVATTSVLATDATETIDLPLARTTDLLEITTNVPAWIRIYATDAARTADAGRLITVDPPSGAGVMADEQTTLTGLSIIQSPVVVFANGDPTPTSIAYLSVTNKDAASQAVTVTIDHLPKEP